MLKAMRTGAQSFVVKFILFGLLLMAMSGLAIMDVQGVFRRGVSDTTVARIGNDKISTTEFEHIVSVTLHEKNIPQATAVKLGMPQAILTQEINGRVFAKAARDMGFIVDDVTAAKNVKKILAPLVQQGLSEKEALDRVLTTSGMTEESFVGSFKSEIETDTLMQLVSSGARAPHQMVSDTLKYKYESRKGDYFKITAADAGKAAPPTENGLKEYYKTIATRFALPEYRNFSVLVLDKKSLGIEQKEPLDALKKYYDEHKADYTAPETRVVAQAVASDEETAKAVYTAAIKSKDLKSAASGKAKVSVIEAQTYTEKDMPVELSPAAFKAREGEVLEPVKSALGWHVLYVKKVTPSVAKTFDSVKDDIEKDMTSDKSAEELYAQANKIDDMLAGGKTLAEVAQQFSLKPVTLTKLDAHGNMVSGKKAETSLPVFDKVLEQAFRLNKGETGQLIEAPTGEFLIVSVTGVTPPENQPFEKVREAVQDSWKQKQVTDFIDTQASKISARIKQGEAFEKIAASFGKTPQTTDFIARTADNEKSGFERGFIPALFSLEKAGDATAITSGDTVVVVRFAARRNDMPKDPGKEETASLESQLNHALQNDILEQYRSALFAKYDVSINDKLVREMFKPQEQEDESGSN